MKIGICLPTETEAMNGDTAGGLEILRLARLAEDSGFDSVWVVDHFCYLAAAEMEALGPDALDAWMEISSDHDAHVNQLLAGDAVGLQHFR